MEEQKSIISKIFDQVRKFFNNQEVHSYDWSAESLSSNENNFDIINDFGMQDMYLLDSEEQEYFYPDNFISENNYIYQDQEIPEIFDNVIVDLATDIKDYLNTYASLPVLPFGALEGNREEWIQAFSKDLLTNHGEWCKREIYEVLTSLIDMESSEIKEDAQKLLYRIEQLELNEEQTKGKKPMKEVFSESIKKSELHKRDNAAEQVEKMGRSDISKKEKKDDFISID